MNEEYKSLASTVALALAEQQSAEVLREPSILIGYCRDYMDPNTVEFRVMERNCTKELLVPYAGGMSSVTDLGLAASHAYAYLVGERVVNERAAELVSRGIADGILLWWNGDGDSRENDETCMVPHDDGCGIPEYLDNWSGEDSTADTDGTKRNWAISKAAPIVLGIVAVAIVAGVFGLVGGSSASSTSTDGAAASSSMAAGDDESEEAESADANEKTDEPTTVTVSFYEEKGGKLLETKEVEAGTEVKIPDLARDGSTLEKWDYEGNILYGLQSGDSVTVNEDMDVYAVWREIVGAPEGITVELITSDDKRAVRSGPKATPALEEQAVIIVHNESDEDRELYVKPGRQSSLLGKTYVIAAGQSGVLASAVSDYYEVNDFDPDNAPTGVFYETREEGSVVKRRDYNVGIREAEVGQGILTLELSNLGQLGNTFFELGVLATKDDDVIFGDGTVTYDGNGDVWMVQLDVSGGDINWQDYERRYFVEAQFV